ncbi:Odorant receptor 49b, partial [Trachymyrmex zeteki]
FAVYIYTSMALFMMIPMSPQIMDIVMPLNDSRPRKLLIEVEYRVDREKYYYPILFHSYVAIILCISIVVCVDTTYISYVEHGCGLFAAIGYRLEHIISKGHIDKTSYFAKSKERTYQDVEVEDTCFKEKAIFYEFVTCLQKHQLAIQYVRVLESSFTLSTGIQLLCNVVGISLIGIQFKGLLQHMQDDWNNLLTSEETQILTHYAEKSRKLMLAYSISVIGFVFCYALLPLTGPVFDIILPLNETRPRKLPHLADFVIFDQEKYYYALLLILYVGYVVCVSIAVAADILYIFLVEHICGMYGILCHRLRNLIAHDDLQWIDGDYIHEEIGRYVRRCIQLHERIRLFIEMMESTISLFLFFDVGLGFLLHTSSCIMIIVRMGSSEIMRYVALMLMQSCRLFFNSWAGQEVTDHSVEVSIAAYDGIWYNASVKVQKLLLFLIVRSQKASQITIAKLYVINLEGFKLINSTFAIFLFFEIGLGFVMHCTLCTTGQQIMDRSIDVYISAYNGAWYETTNTVKKMFLMLIMKSQIISEIKIAFLFKRMRRLNDFYDVLPTFLGTCICLLKTIGLQWQTEKVIFTLTGAASFVTAPLTVPLLDSILMLNITRSKRMPHPTEFFLDMEKYYYILLAITIVGYSVCCTVIVATDTIYLALLQHTCGTLAILSYRLKKLAAHDKSKKCLDPTSKEDRDVENMVNCIQLQIRIERLIYLIESTFATCLITDIGLGILLQCTACVMIVTRTELVRNGPLVLIQSLRFFFNSWLGQKIIDHSSQISVAAYNGMWYQTCSKAKKMLLFLLMKCQKPYHITMAKLYVICLESYGSLMKTSASYVTVMVSLNSDDIFWGLAAGITDLNIIMENTSPLLVNSFIIIKILNCMFTNDKVLGLYAMWLFYTTSPIIISGIYTLLLTNETYSARFLYRLEHVLDIDKYFKLLMLHGFISVFYIVSVPIAVDTTFTLCIQHICALFECLR